MRKIFVFLTIILLSCFGNAYAYEAVLSHFDELRWRPVSQVPDKAVPAAFAFAVFKSELVDSETAQYYLLDEKTGLLLNPNNTTQTIKRVVLLDPGEYTIQLKAVDVDGSVYWDKKVVRALPNPDYYTPLPQKYDIALIYLKGEKNIFPSRDIEWLVEEMDGVWSIRTNGQIELNWTVLHIEQDEHDVAGFPSLVQFVKDFINPDQGRDYNFLLFLSDEEIQPRVCGLTAPVYNDLPWYAQINDRSDYGSNELLAYIYLNHRHLVWPEGYINNFCHEMLHCLAGFRAYWPAEKGLPHQSHAHFPIRFWDVGHSPGGSNPGYWLQRPDGLWDKEGTFNPNLQNRVQLPNTFNQLYLFLLRLIDFKDLVPFPYFAEGTMNNSGQFRGCERVNIFPRDMLLFLGIYKRDALPGDINHDRIVDTADLVLVGNNFGKTGLNIKGDVNGDGAVDIADLVLVGRHFGTSR